MVWAVFLLSAARMGIWLDGWMERMDGGRWNLAAGLVDSGLRD